MKKRRVTVWIVVFCITIISIKQPMAAMAALDDVYFTEEIDYGTYWEPILVDGYYCSLYYHKAIYATECKGKVLKFPTVIQYNHKAYHIKMITEKLEQTEGYEYDTYGYFPGYKNKNKVEKIMIPNGVSKVELRALHTWKNLKEIHIPESVVSKEMYLSHMNGKVVIDKKNKKYKTSGNGVYTKDTKKLRAAFGTKKTFTVKSGTKGIDKDAFADYKTLQKVIVPTSVKSVHILTFQGCKNLKSIIIKGKKAPSFGKKSDLQWYDINDETKKDVNIELNDMPKKVTIYVKNKEVKRAIDKTLKIGNLKKLKWKVKVKKNI